METISANGKTIKLLVVTLWLALLCLSGLQTTFFFVGGADKMQKQVKGAISLWRGGVVKGGGGRVY